MGTADIITDLLIVGFPIPIVLKSAMVVQRQQYRSLFASLEILAAAAVSNALVLGSFVRDRGTKKQRFRFGSTGGHSSLERGANAPRRAITAKTWGSDADLVGDLGMRLDPELTEKPPNNPRPAPIASPSILSPTAMPHDNIEQEFRFPEPRSIRTDETDLKPSDPIQSLNPSQLSTSPKRMSFFDVGGLLGNDYAAHMHSQQQSSQLSPQSSQTPPQNSPSQHPSTTMNATTEANTRRGSHTLMQDMGGLASTSPTYNSTPQAVPTAAQPAPESEDPDLKEALQFAPPETSKQSTRPPPPKRKQSLGFQDVGGLLS
ncbi:hypothetical protein ACLMJK_007361 [Lecanora helva]